MIVQQKEATLRVTETGATYELKSPVTTIGRSEENDIVVDSPLVSRRHAELRKENGAWYIQDLYSPNGIEVNSFRLQRGECYPLGQRSRIILASAVELEFEEADNTPDFGQTQVLSTNLLTPQGSTSELDSYESGATTVLNETYRPQTAANPAKKPEKKKGSKLPLVLGLVAVVAILAGVFAYYRMTEGFKSAAVRDLQQEIRAIGEVTLDSEEQLRSARAHLDALSDADRARVENAALLEQSEQNYDILVHQAEAARFDESVKALGPVELGSEEALIALRQNYEALDEQTLRYVTAEGALTEAEHQLQHLKDQAAAELIDQQILSLGEIELKSEKNLKKARAAYDGAAPAVQQLVQNLGKLENAEKTWQALKAENDYAEVAALIAARDYEKLTESGPAFLETYPASEHAHEISDACVTAFLQLSKQYEYQRQYELAKKMLEDGLAHELEADNGRLQAAADALNRVITNMRPQNGAVFGGNRGGGYGKIVVNNGDSDVLVKLEDTTNPALFIVFYVRAGETAKLSIVDGSYHLKYASGETWYGMDAKFGEDTVYNQADTELVFTTTYEGGYVNYVQHEITLYQVLGGNMSTTDIDGAEF